MRHLYRELSIGDAREGLYRAAAAFLDDRFGRTGSTPVGLAKGARAAASELRQRWDQEAERLRADLDPLPEKAHELVETQWEPMGHLRASWLGRAIVAINSHTPLAAGLLRLYEGCEPIETARACPLAALAERSDLLDGSFELPVLALCCGLFPQGRLPELLGLAWLLLRMGPPPILLAVRGARGAQTALVSERVAEAADALLETAAQASPEAFWSRFGSALAAAEAALQAWTLALMDELRRRPRATTPGSDSPETGSGLTPPALPLGNGGKDLLEGGELAANEMYHRLLNVERHPDALPAARRFVERRLARARYLLPLLSQPPISGDSYDRELVEKGVRRQHELQIASYRGPRKPIWSREDVKWIVLQMAPMCLVDGCWLGRAVSIAAAAPEVGRWLWRIYAEEVGSGDPDAHHSNAYRRYFDELHISLPEMGTGEFAHHRELGAAAFEVPALWLALSQFPETLLPELLGLNLSVELSGVGGRYRSTADLFRHHGIDPQLLELHERADSPVDGHARFALEAIHAYFAESGLPRDRVRALWARVQAGYVAQRIASARMALYLAPRLSLRLARRFLGLSRGP